MTEYDDYVSGSVDASYEKWLKKNLPEHRPEYLMTQDEKQREEVIYWQSHYADCKALLEQTQAKLAAAEAEARGWAESFKMAEQSIAELQAEVEQLNEGIAFWMESDQRREAEVERLTWMLEESVRLADMEFPFDVADLARRWGER